MAEHKMARTAQQQQSLASGGALNMSPKHACRAFVCYEAQVHSIGHIKLLQRVLDNDADLMTAPTCLPSFGVTISN
jgi:hypothetical protein